MYSGLYLFFNDTPTTEIYTLSLHDALPIWPRTPRTSSGRARSATSASARCWSAASGRCGRRSEEHTSELQSQSNLVCRLLLEKKNLPPLVRSLWLSRLVGDVKRAGPAYVSC